MILCGNLDVSCRAWLAGRVDYSITVNNFCASDTYSPAATPLLDSIGGYMHPLFVRDVPELCRQIVRRSSKPFANMEIESSTKAARASTSWPKKEKAVPTDGGSFLDEKEDSKTSICSTDMDDSLDSDNSSTIKNEASNDPTAFHQSSALRDWFDDGVEDECSCFTTDSEKRDPIKKPHGSFCQEKANDIVSSHRHHGLVRSMRIRSRMCQCWLDQEEKDENPAASAVIRADCHQ
jgi:hypothetical protein